ncbi:putative ATP-dependent DNA helicase PcrA [Bacteriovorax sp. BSW11_IV]|uniref:ATP-dependent helicase n=1 Tax=Bacteriovorax sp. BSW11_IV TaxID=1353529 RepID=UPI000389F21C|nr:UvrD-helicase domain-containing protein [Bacteriovorax sp. BSW11_IV]EQC47071.1 putative ATP-dependent DNA helicase PcrA [Bacteriovorax sp. BSW11_IV]
MNINGLNEAQKQAVLNTEGPVMILAGAGSGKTRTLVTRISYLLEELHISPYQVLALTFSNKAAKEMRERVSTLVQSDIGALQVTTFHAFCARVLRSEANYLGLSRNFTIYDTSESKAIAKTLLARRGISTKEINPFEILYYIDDLKNHGHYPGRDEENLEYEVDKGDPFFGYYTEYEAELHKANATDFGGLITGVIQLFEKYPDVLKRYQERFKYILVDEYQDTNRAQFDLIKMLSETHHNICVVGDEDQSIYSWRGADIRNILDFEKTFKSATLLKLEQNYRSSKNIIEAASCVISRNTQRKGKSMWTDNPEGESIEIIECHSDKDEAEFIANQVSELIKNKVPCREIAVFYRTNSQSRIIEDYLRRANLPYRVVGGVKFYDRKEIKDLLSYLRLIVNGKDSLALSRIINVPTRGIGATSLRKLEEEAVRNNASLWEVISGIVDNVEEYSHLKMSAKVKSSLSQFATLINEVKVLETQEVSPSVLYEKVLHESGYYDFLKSSSERYEAQARIENLEELTNAIKQYEETTKNPSLTGFLETITLDSNIEEADSNSGEISLMTIHGAKGLEFYYVFLAGAEENVFPSFRSLEDGENGIEEERRLFYVAMTRAMKRLYIMFAQGRMLFGQLKFNGPSRFINEIPDKYYLWRKPNGATSARGRTFEREWEDDYSQEGHYDDEPVYQVQSTPSDMPKPKFPKGTKVAHGLYGQGIILETEGLGNDEKVVIKFSDGAKKKFMVKFAPLTLL